MATNQFSKSSWVSFSSLTSLTSLTSLFLLTITILSGVGCEKEKEEKTPIIINPNPQMGYEPSLLKVNVKNLGDFNQTILDDQFTAYYQVEETGGVSAADYAFLCALTDISSGENLEDVFTPCTGGQSYHQVSGLNENTSYMLRIKVKNPATGVASIAFQGFFRTGDIDNDGVDGSGDGYEWGDDSDEDITFNLKGQYEVTMPRSMRIVNFTTDRTIYSANYFRSHSRLIRLKELRDESVFSWSCHDFGRQPYRPSQDYALSTFPDYENGENEACFKMVNHNELRDISQGTISRNQITFETTPAVRAQTGVYEALIIRQFRNYDEFSYSADFYDNLCRDQFAGPRRGKTNAQMPARYGTKDAEFRSCVGGFIQDADARVLVNQLLSTDKKTEIVYITTEFSRTETGGYNRIIELLEPR